MQLRPQSVVLVFSNKGECKKGDKCLFPHRSEKGFLVTKVTDRAQSHPANTDGTSKAGANASEQQQQQLHAAKANAKTKAKAKKGAAAVASIASEDP